MIVTRENLAGVIERFSGAGRYAVDTETTGLHPYLGDHLFSIILADAHGAVYFNFKTYPGLSGEFVLPDTSVLKAVFDNPASYWFAHNAKFDLAMLRRDGLQIAGTVHCTQAIAKVLRNDKFSYSLDTLAGERGHTKDDAAKEYVMKNKLWEWRTIPGKATRKKDLHYDQVPFDIMAPYGLRDGVITRELGLAQIKDVDDIDSKSEKKMHSIKSVYLNELQVTKALFEIEWEGVATDPAYIAEALAYEEGIKDDAEARFKAITGTPYKDSPKALAATFSALGVPFGRNEPTAEMVEKARAKGVEPVGNPCFDSDALESIDHELAGLVVMQRSALKKAGTYYRSFQFYSDDNGTLHCTFKQDGADTGRMSCSEPNLQNIPKRGEDKSSYPVRKAFVTPPEFCLVMIDYQAMEFRLMLEYAKEYETIEKVIGGLDVHTATAEKIGIDRVSAKTLNFLLIYGGGVGKLASALKISHEAAFQLREAYFSAMPGVKKLIREVPLAAEKRGFIMNWFGRRCHLSDPKFSYKMPNYLIQGGCADVVKVALVKCAARLKGMRSKILLQIHDELFFKIHKDELDVVPELKDIMEKAYPYKLLPLTCSVEHSWTNWHDKKEGFPCL